MKRSRRALFIFLYMVGLFLFLEGVSRLALALLSKTWEPVVPTSVQRLDPLLGWGLQPGVCATSKRTGRPVEYCINAKGLRDEEYDYEKPKAKTFRVVLLGDSRSFGFGVPQELHFSTVLEGYFKNFQVINMGVDGYGVDQELLWLRREGFKYDPDIVMVYVAHYAERRHMIDKAWGVGKPRFELQNGELVLHNSPVANNDTLYVALRGVDNALSSWFKTFKILRDVAVHIVEGKALKHWLNAGKPKPVVQGEGERVTQDQALEERTHVLAETIVLTMAREAKEHGAAFVLLTQIERLYNTVTNAGYLALNVTDPLHNTTFPFPDGLEHFNEAGNGALAWEIARFLLAYDLIPEKSRREHSAFDFPVHREAGE